MDAIMNILNTVISNHFNDITDVCLLYLSRDIFKKIR